MKEKYELTTGKTLRTILIYFFVFIAGELVSGIILDFVFSFVEFSHREWYVIIRKWSALGLTFLLFWLYTVKVLHLKMRDFGIRCRMNKWCVGLAFLLPISVVAVYWFIGKKEVTSFSVGEIILIIIASLSIGLKSGITEEMLFRGYIMKLLENRWNKIVAILVPSFVFSLVHIPSMENFSVAGVALLIMSGTLVGVMFSLAAYKDDSIGNSVWMHAVWNMIMITDILHITSRQGMYGKPIVSIILSTENPMITGGEFGIEASMISIIAYALACVVIGLIPKHK